VCGSISSGGPDLFNGRNRFAARLGVE